MTTSVPMELPEMSSAVPLRHSGVWYARTALTLLAAVVVWIVTLISAGPALLGWPTFVVTSGSMEPAISSGSVAVVETVAAADIDVKDIIAYVDPRGEVITHRVMFALDSPDGREFLTKGDANAALDAGTVHEVNVVGRVQYSVPAAGALLESVGRPEVRGVIVVLLAGTLVRALLVRLAGRRRPAPVG